MHFHKKRAAIREWTCQQSDWFDISHVGVNTAIVVSVKKGAKGFDQNLSFSRSPQWQY
jgi:hypothetical protein